MIKIILKHIKIILKHKWMVFKLCCKVGMPWRGLKHDMSKFSPTEFFESIKYYTGTNSPILGARTEKGYSETYLHHIGRNKNHLEYWLDFETKQIAPVIPYKYVVETVCDDLAAGIVYNGKNWNNGTQYEYWKRKRQNIIINPKIDNFLTEVFLEVKENGIDKTLTKKNMEGLYKKYCIDDKTEYICEIKKEWKKVEKGNDENGK